MAIRPEVLYRALCDDIDDQFGPGFSTNALKYGPLWPSIRLPEAYASSILSSFLRKFEGGRTKSTDLKALDKFLQVNQACKEWSLPSQIDSKLETLLGEYKRAIYEFWYKDGFGLWDHPFALLERGKVGPGVNIGANGEDFYTKFFDSRLSCSSLNLYKAYSLYIKRFPRWADAEEIRRRLHGEPSVHESSRLSFVPKNDEISRCICIEPSLNTFFQLGAADILNRRISERFGISLDTQQFKNRNLARLGSITDNLSTLDLSSASDSISLKMLEYSLPPHFMRELTKLRCPYVDIKGRGTVELHMISTMGNGFTFPLQTMLFSCMVVASLRFRGIPVRSDEAGEQWGVNGDDIICPEICTQDVISLLTTLGFSLNHDKSFVKGPFRESCGSDFFMGSDIRGVYVKSLRSLGSRYAVINQLIRFSTKSGISFPRVLDILVRSVPKNLVPRWENADSGIQVPLSIARPSLRVDKDIQGHVYRAFCNLSPKIRIRDDGRIVVPRHAKPRSLNYDGLVIAFLQQSVHSMSIGLRSKSDKYRAKRRVTSSFDADPVQFPGHPDWGLDWQQWETVVLSALERGLRSPFT